MEVTVYVSVGKKERKETERVRWTLSGHDGGANSDNRKQPINLILSPLLQNVWGSESYSAARQRSARLGIAHYARGGAD